jgi:hypothetical protein
VNQVSLFRFRRLPTPHSNQRRVAISIAARVPVGRIGVYSAAATNFGFTFAADMMKSEMRGTISDLKREPLKTP